MSDDLNARYLEVVVYVLKMANRPLKWNELVDGIRITWPNYTIDHRVEVAIYNVMAYHLRLYGDKGAFRKAGRGIFVASEYWNPVTMKAPKDNSAYTIEGKLKQDERQRFLSLPRTCGSCAHISYEGIEEVHLARGECGCWRETGKLGVSSSADASECPYWAMRGWGKMNAERAKAEKLREALIEINHRITSGKREAL